MLWGGEAPWYQVLFLFFYFFYYFYYYLLPTWQSVCAWVLIPLLFSPSLLRYCLYCFGGWQDNPFHSLCFLFLSLSFRNPWRVPQGVWVGRRKEEIKLSFAHNLTCPWYPSCCFLIALKSWWHASHNTFRSSRSISFRPAFFFVLKMAKRSPWHRHTWLHAGSTSFRQKEDM